MNNFKSVKELEEYYESLGYELGDSEPYDPFNPEHNDPDKYVIINGTVDVHTAHVMDAAAVIADERGLTGEDRAVLLLGALCHDLGKPSTTERQMKNGVERITSHGHEEAGVSIASQFMDRIGIKSKIKEQVLPLVGNHMLHITYDPKSPKGNVRQIAEKLFPATIEQLEMIIRSDMGGRPPLPGGLPEPAQMMVDDAQKEGVYKSKITPYIQGRDIMDMFINIPPSQRKIIGDTLKYVYDLQLQGKVNDKNQALVAAEAFARKNLLMINGKDILDIIGGNGGPHIREILDNAWKAQLNKEFNNREEGFEWIRRNYGIDKTAKKKDLNKKLGNRSFISKIETMLPQAGSEVSGLRVGNEIPNTDSIGASFNDWYTLDGIREVKTSWFDKVGYSIDDDIKSKNLAQEIKKNNYINPLIVVYDEDGPYILEGGHRLDSLIELGIPSFPALVVIDIEDFSDHLAESKSIKKKGQQQLIFGDDEYQNIDDLEQIKEKVEYGEYEDIDYLTVDLERRGIDFRVVTFNNNKKIVIVGDDPYSLVLDVDNMSVKDAHEWVFELNDFALEDLISSEEVNFWEGIREGSIFYHATNCDNIETILQTGLEARHDSRVSSNKWLGAGVFASDNIYDIEPYGDCIIQINAFEMKKDGFTPEVMGEPGMDEVELRSSVAHMMGLDSFIDESYSYEGISDTTVIFQASIPAKYLSLYTETEAKKSNWYKTAQSYLPVNNAIITEFGEAVSVAIGKAGNLVSVSMRPETLGESFVSPEDEAGRETVYIPLNKYEELMNKKMKKDRELEVEKARQENEKLRQIEERNREYENRKSQQERQKNEGQMDLFPGFGKDKYFSQSSWYKTAQSLTLLDQINSLKSQIVAYAQKIYDDWEQDEEGIDEVFGGGGICDAISDGIQSIIVESIPDVEVIEGSQDGDDHAFCIVYKKSSKEAYIVDIPFGIYEKGGFYSWKKIKNIEIKENDIEIIPVDYNDVVFDDQEFDSTRQAQKKPNMAPKYLYHLSPDNFNQFNVNLTGRRFPDVSNKHGEQGVYFSPNFQSAIKWAPTIWASKLGEESDYTNLWLYKVQIPKHVFSELSEKYRTNWWEDEIFIPKEYVHELKIVGKNNYGTKQLNKMLNNLLQKVPTRNNPLINQEKKETKSPEHYDGVLKIRKLLERYPEIKSGNKVDYNGREIYIKQITDGDRIIYSYSPAIWYGKGEYIEEDLFDFIQNYAGRVFASKKIAQNDPYFNNLTKEEKQKLEEEWVSSYFSVGHGSNPYQEEGLNPKDALWVYGPMGFEVVNFKDRKDFIFTHRHIWGDEIYDCWKGRYDEYLKKISVVPPSRYSVFERELKIPAQVRRKLEQFFPSAEIVCFGCKEAKINSWYKMANVVNLDDKDIPYLMYERKNGVPQSPKEVETILLILINKYKKNGISQYMINDGYCAEFAEEAYSLLNQAEMYETGFSVYENSELPVHEFIKVDNLFYDSEAPSGVFDWKELPIYKRFFNESYSDLFHEIYKQYENEKDIKENKYKYIEETDRAVWDRINQKYSCKKNKKTAQSHSDNYDEFGVPQNEVNIDDLVEFHKLEYMLSHLDRRDYVSNQMKVFQMREKANLLANKIISKMIKAFQNWVDAHTESGWFLEHGPGILANMGEEGSPKGLYYINIYDEVRKEVAKEMGKNPREIKGFDIHGQPLLLIAEKAILDQNMDVILSQPLGQKYFEEFKQEITGGFDGVLNDDEDGEISDDTKREFSEWMNNNGITPYEFEGIDPKIDATDIMEVMNYAFDDPQHFWNSFIFSITGEEVEDEWSATNGHPYEMRRFFDIYAGPYFNVFERVAKDLGMHQWKTSIDANTRDIGYFDEEGSPKQVDRIVKNIKDSLNRLKEASESNSFKDKAIAITLALNTAHVTGKMTEYIGLDSSDLKYLSNLDSKQWDKELERISSKNKRYKKSEKEIQGYIMPHELTEDDFEELENYINNTLIDEDDYSYIWSKDIQDNINTAVQTLAEESSHKNTYAITLQEAIDELEYMGEDIIAKGLTDIILSRQNLQEVEVQKIREEQIAEDLEPFERKIFNYMIKNSVESYDFLSTAYILPDGTTLSLGTGYGRKDHRTLSDYLMNFPEANLKRNEMGAKTISLNALEYMGVIRVIPEYPAFEFKVSPTRSQQRVLRDMISEYFGTHNKGITIFTPNGQEDIYSSDDLYSRGLSNYFQASNKNWYKTALKEHDKEFETGKPVTFNYGRNPTPSANFGELFQQHIEPAGRFMTHPYPDLKLEGWEYGEVTFNNPLVIPLNTEFAPETGIYNENSWKAELHRRYKGLTGKALSKAIAKDGYDGIVTVTVGPKGEIVDTREILDLTMFHKKANIENNEKIISPAIYVKGKLYTGITHGHAISKALEEGAMTEKEFDEAWGNTDEINTDLFITNKGRVLDRFEASFQFNISASENMEVDTLSLDELKKKFPDKIAQSNKDFVYLKAIENGDLNKAQKMVEEEARSQGFNIGPVYHGGASGFNEFSQQFLGTTGEGQGYYFTDDKVFAQSYVPKEGGRLISVYLKMPDYLTLEEKNISREDYKNLLMQLDPNGENYLSNWGDVSFEGYENVLNTAVEKDYDSSNTDIELIGNLINSGESLDDVYSLVEKITGKSGTLVEREIAGVKDKIYVVPRSSQIKLSDPVVYDDEGNIIPLSKRFENVPDIRGNCYV